MKKLTKPFYPDDRRIEETAYMGPRRAGKRFWAGEYGKNPRDPEGGYPSFFTDEVFEDYKNAGLTFLMPEGDAYFEQKFTETGLAFEPDFEKSPLYTFMKMAEKHGLDVYPACEAIFGNMTHTDGPFGDEEKYIVHHFVETVQKYCPKSFKGIMLTDEPGIASIGRVKKIVEYLNSDEIRAIKPDLDVFSSMLPNYATLPSYQLGYQYPDRTKQSVVFDEERKGLYANFIDACADAVGEFSFDFYPLGEKGRLSPGFYQNLEMAAEHGRDGNFPISVTLQSFMMLYKYNHKTGRGIIIYRSPSYEDVRWQVYSSLAFGVQRLGWFTFWQHYSESEHEMFPNAMLVYDECEKSGYRKTDIYHAVAKVNREIQAIDHVFLRFKWKGCRKIATSRDRNIRLLDGGYDGGCLRTLTGTRDTLLGCFENPEDGAEGYWLVNAHNPYWLLQNDVSVTFAGATHAVCYRNGEEQVLPLEQVTENGETCGKLSMRLSCGEGVFVIPYTE